MSKLHVNIESINAAEYKKNTHSMPINYGFHSSIFGNCLIGITGETVCYLSFPKDKSIAVDEMQHHWPHSSLVENSAKTLEVLEKLLDKKHAGKVSLLVKGTPFQISVWQALATIPFGSRIAYEAVAQKIGNARAVRAAASAVANNNISFLIPCHRVVKKSGEIHKYRWGANLKQQLLEWESA